MSDIQVDWQLWLKTQTSLSGSPKPCLHSPVRSLLRVHQRSWSGQKVPDHSCSGKPPACPCWATSTSPCVTYRHRFLLPSKASRPYLPLSWLRSLLATPPQGCAYPLPSPTSTATAEGWQWTGWEAPSPRQGGCTKDNICHILPSPEDESHF